MIEPEACPLAVGQRLGGMDSIALSLCMDNALPIHVFELAEGNIERVAAGERIGTIVATPRVATPKEES